MFQEQEILSEEQNGSNITTAGEQNIGRQNGRQTAAATEHGEGRQVPQGIWASLINRQLLMGLVPIQMPDGIVRQFIRQYSVRSAGSGTNAAANNANGTEANAANGPANNTPNIEDPEIGIPIPSQQNANGPNQIHLEMEDKQCSESQINNIRLVMENSAEVGESDGRNMLRISRLRELEGNGREENDGGEEEEEDDISICGAIRYSTFNVHLYFGMFLCFVAVLGYALVEIIRHNFVPSLSILFAFSTLYDTMAFIKCVSGGDWAWLIPLRIAIRQFLILYILGQHNVVFSALIFSLNHDQPTFWKNFYLIVLADVFISDCTLALKILVFYMPESLKNRKGMLYQWLEYSSLLYKFVIPFVHWNAYVDIFWWTCVYAAVKAWILFDLVLFWLFAFIKLFRGPPKIGKKPTKLECKEQHQECTICQSEFCKPIKLECGHIFCTKCIQTWLQEKNTCPFCRAIIPEATEEKKYKDGGAQEFIYF